MTEKKAYLLFFTCLVSLLHLPVVFAKTTTSGNFQDTTQIIQGKFVAQTVEKLSVEAVDCVTINSMYDSLQLASLGMGREVFNYAIEGFHKVKQLEGIENDDIISIIDFSRPSNLKRFFVIDLKNYKVLFYTYVAHGINSGKEFARQFSNIMESNQSSLGFYKTVDTYFGKHGYSLHLQGLERGINDNAFKRDIVVHGADYVSEAVAKSGCLGRSHGCPAIPEKLRTPIINKIRNGSCLFIYGADRRYLAKSRLLKTSITYAVAMK